MDKQEQINRINQVLNQEQLLPKKEQNKALIKYCKKELKRIKTNE